MYSTSLSEGEQKIEEEKEVPRKHRDIVWSLMTVDFIENCDEKKFIFFIHGLY